MDIAGLRNYLFVAAAELGSRQDLAGQVMRDYDGAVAAGMDQIARLCDHAMTLISPS